jgi:hypothetical protein
MLKCQHLCNCACSSEIGKCKINDGGRQTAHEKQRKYTFYAHVLKINSNFQRQKKKLFKKLPSLMTLHCIPLTLHTKFSIIVFSPLIMYLNNV